MFQAKVRCSYFWNVSWVITPPMIPISMPNLGVKSVFWFRLSSSTLKYLKDVQRSPKART